jgi:hypothetical protein
MKPSRVALSVAALFLGACAPTSPEPEPAPAEPLTEAKSPAANANQSNLFADWQFWKVWSRNDRPIAEGWASRSYTYGPYPITSGQLYEPYQQSPNGLRLVQYFDKGRLEITDPAKNPDDPYYVSRGLIVKEMVTGLIQVGDAANQARGAAQEAVAGDPAANNPECPRYANFAASAFPQYTVPSQVGASANDSLSANGTRGTVANAHGVTKAYYDADTRHHVASVFWSYLNKTNEPILNPTTGARTTGALFNPWTAVVGLPITEPYWVKARVGGTLKDVLVQLFERRVLTYTPSNPTAYQVEMGNVGQHYYQWRYNPGNSIAGVHWYSGDPGLIGSGGKRGYNVEIVFNAFARDQGAIDKAARAAGHGLTNIIRIDAENYLAVPRECAPHAVGQRCWDWAYSFAARVNDFNGIANIFIVGNEPNLEGQIPAETYANAFNLLYAQHKKKMPAGTVLLVTGPSGFSGDLGNVSSGLGWFRRVTGLVQQMDGLGIHTYGSPSEGCPDPRTACSRGGWNFDGGFRWYRDQLNALDAKWRSPYLPVYITEFNTDTNGEPPPNPVDEYPAGWINKAFEEIRNYNATRGSAPVVKTLAWFVDENHGGWETFALTNPAPTMQRARSDMRAEFLNGANYLP